MTTEYIFDEVNDWAPSEARLIVAEQSHPLATPSLWIGTTSDGPGPILIGTSNPDINSLFKFTCLIGSTNINNELPNEIICGTLIHSPTTLDDQDSSFDQVKFSSFYVGPKSDSCPLIMWPHGGPHAVTLKDFKNDLGPQSFTSMMADHYYKI